MSWKKVGLFVLLFIVGIIFFGVITFFYYSDLLLPLFIAYIILIILILKEYTRQKLIILLTLVVLYLLIMVISFPVCSSYHGRIYSKTCTCIGIEKFPLFYIAWNDQLSQCVGIPTHYVCYNDYFNLIPCK